MAETIAIEIRQLRKSYGTTQVLFDLDLEVRAGEIFGFLGPNGAGKTTTIRCLLDLIHRNGGDVRVFGIDPAKDPVGVRAMVGYLPGELRLDEGQTARGTIQNLARLRGQGLDWDYVEGIAARMDLDLEEPMKNFSKGNKQKVGVLQALMARPKLLLLDEPTSGLDPLVQQTVLGMVREAAEAGTTVFFSSHVLSEVQAIAERVGIIRHGRLIETANTQSLLERALQRVRVKFDQLPATTTFEAIPGVQSVATTAGGEVILEVSGEMDAVIKALAEYRVLHIETERASLEEIFLAYYQDADAGTPLSQEVKK